MLATSGLKEMVGATAESMASLKVTTTENVAPPTVSASLIKRSVATTVAMDGAARSLLAVRSPEVSDWAVRDAVTAVFSSILRTAPPELIISN